MEKINKFAIIALACILMSLAISFVATAQDEYTDYFMTEEGSALFGLGIMAMGICSIVWFIIWILIGIWVYKDAEKRGKSGVLWLILVIILGIIGLIIWLVVRPKEIAPKQ